MTVRDRVAGELRHRILLGSLVSGQRIDLDALSAEFGTSRTPVREACLDLANDGLVRLAPRSGITVLGITDSDLLDNFELMASLSGMAAGWAAERANDDERARMRALSEAVAQASSSGGDVATANFEFHRSVNQSSHAPRVTALIARAARLFPDRLSDVVPEQASCSLPEHAQIVDAIEAGDGRLARSVMEGHFHQAADRLRHHLAGRVDDGGAQGT
ncbi:GntR family transcriptional regulator [Aeromicrobium fastidiosum]|uniref:GntR family transcriptional regulator n=1 Tax=Aeromicrobium TaxID=2040 RepID=UPI00177E142B|nr:MULTISPECIES: GntR family transcriptional regulator [Aeromicrobium]MBD8605503.1 GntR family transcriptional regulator [Aeromicrobium sp. CFBP 8757]MCL8250420.1 GntR family transcriptional regulator [Aeromicrobium fastidiosum]